MGSTRGPYSPVQLAVLGLGLGLVGLGLGVGARRMLLVAR